MKVRYSAALAIVSSLFLVCSASAQVFNIHSIEKLIVGVETTNTVNTSGRSAFDLGVDTPVATVTSETTTGAGFVYHSGDPFSLSAILNTGGSTFVPGFGYSQTVEARVGFTLPDDFCVADSRAFIYTRTGQWLMPEALAGRDCSFELPELASSLQFFSEPTSSSLLLDIRPIWTHHLYVVTSDGRLGYLALNWSAFN